MIFTIVNVLIYVLFLQALIIVFFMSPRTSIVRDKTNYELRHVILVFSFLIFFGWNLVIGFYTTFMRLGII